MAEQNIPVVDLDTFVHGDAEAQARFVGELGAALVEYGFVAVENHGVDGDALAGTYHELKRLFDLPLDTKRAFEVVEGGRQRGSGYHLLSLPAQAGPGDGDRQLQLQSVVQHLRQVLSQAVEIRPPGKIDGAYLTGRATSNLLILTERFPGQRPDPAQLPIEDASAAAAGSSGSRSSQPRRRSSAPLPSRARARAWRSGRCRRRSGASRPSLRGPHRRLSRAAPTGRPRVRGEAPRGARGRGERRCAALRGR